MGVIPVYCLKLRINHTNIDLYSRMYPSPSEIREFLNGRLSIANHMDFVDLKDYLTVDYEVNCDGRLIQSGQIACLPSIKPHQEQEICLPVRVPEKGRCYLKLLYRNKNRAEILKEGDLLGFDEIRLHNRDGRNQTVAALLKERGKGLDAATAGMEKDGMMEGETRLTRMKETDRSIGVWGQRFHYTFDKRTGLFEAMTYHGQALLTRPMEINIWRAPTDNDRKIKLEWKRAFYDQASVRAYETTCRMEEGGIRIRSLMSLAAPSIQRILDLEAEWLVEDEGAVTVTVHVVRQPEFPELPRFGLRLFLPRRFDQVSYYGIGPEESYVDKRRAGSHGIYTSKVLGLHEDYIRPQENGSHYNCDYVRLEGQDMGITAVSPRPFSFQASVYTQEELTAKAHNYELVPCGSTVLCLDYRQNGIGSNSCGPRLLETYRFTEPKFTFELKLIPV